MSAGAPQLRLRQRQVEGGELALEPAHQPVELLQVVGVEPGAGCAYGGTLDDAAAAQDLLADREADARLVFGADDRQEGRVDVPGPPRRARANFPPPPHP